MVPSVSPTARAHCNAGVDMSTEGMFERVEGELEEREADATPLTMSDILHLPDTQLALMRHIMRSQEPLTVAQASEGLGWTQAEGERVVGELRLTGLLAVEDDRLKVQPLHSNTRIKPGGLWGTLNDL